MELIIKIVILFLISGEKPNNRNLKTAMENTYELSAGTQIIILISAVIISATIGFTLYWFLFKKKKKNR